MTKKIRLTKGKCALVDNEDFGYLNQWKWHLHTEGYACRSTTSTIIGKRKRIYMHSLINQTPIGTGTDHINGNALDNRKSNLRTANQSQNSMNRKTAYGSSQFKGVCLNKANGRWMAYIGYKRKLKSLGYFDCELAAAKRYNIEAKTLFGEYARLNNV